MIKSRKILAATVMASLLGGVSASYADEQTVTRTITVEAKVGAKTLKDMLKFSANKTTEASKRAAVSTSQESSTIADFLEWDDSNSGDVNIFISSGSTNADGEYIITNGSDEMPVAFQIDGDKIEKSSSSGIDLKSLTQGTKKDLKVIYGDGKNTYPAGTYQGDFTFSIKADF